MWKQYKVGNSRCMVNMKTGHIIMYRGGREMERVDAHIKNKIRWDTELDIANAIATAREIVN